MSHKKHQVDDNLLKSVDALTEMLLEHRIAGEPAFDNRPKSTSDPVPNDPFWTPKNCYLFALNRFYKRWPAAEAIISRDPKSSVDYAINVLDDAWPDDENGRYAENLIKKDPSLALWYAKMAKGRWEEIEPAMASKASWAYEYAKHVLECQWNGPHAKDAENVISSDPYTATLYCMDLKYPKRYDNPRTERMILDSIYGALYAHTVAPQMTIDELNKEVDSKLEAIHVGYNVDLSEVFEESWTNSPILKPDPKTSRPIVLVYYAQEKLKSRWPEAELYILEKCRRNESIDEIHHLFAYALNVIKPYDKKNPNYDRGRWLEAEPIIKTDSHVAYNYALAILKERWQDPAVERDILNSDSAKYYAEYVAKTSEDELREDVEKKLYDLHRHDDIDLTSTTDEAIDRLLPLIAEEMVERDYSSMTPSVVYTYAITDFKTKQLHGEEYKPDPKAEAVMMQDPGAAYYYARDVLNDGKCLGIRWEEAEPTIMSEPYWAYAYAKDVLGRRWKTAENVIKSDTYIAYLYARYIVKPSNPANYDHDNGRWDLETESRILENHDPVIPDNDTEKESEICELYANNVAEMSIEDLKSDIERKLNDLNSFDDIDLTDIDEAIEELLPLITESRREDEIRAMCLYFKAYDNKYANAKGLTPDEERAILKSAEYAYFYAVNVIQGEWPEAEPIILTNPYWAAEYAKDAIKGRWEAAEPIIMQSPRLALSYALDASKARLDPAVELKILEFELHEEDGDSDWELHEKLVRYAHKIAKMKLEELKADALMKMSDLTSGDNTDLSNTVEEASDRLMPLITEGKLPDSTTMTPQECYNYAYNFVKRLAESDECEKWLKEAEEIIKHSPEYATSYAANVLNYDRLGSYGNRKKRFLSAEEYIMKSPKWAYIYARDIYSKSGHKDQLRWEDAEPFIFKDEKYAYYYSQYVAHMPMEQIQADVDKRNAEMLPDEYRDLSGTTDEAFDRLGSIISEEDEALPDFRMMTPVEAFEYVYDVINKGKYLGIRCLEAEPIIAKDPELAYFYAMSVINKDRALGMRWPEAELVPGGLKDSPKWAYYYVKEVINQGRDYGERWFGCENAIIKDKTATAMYAKNFAKMSVDEFVADVKSREESISHRDDEDFSDMTDEAINRLMPLLSETSIKGIKTRPDPSKMTPADAFWYVINVINKDNIRRRSATKTIKIINPLERWVDAEPIIAKNPDLAFAYMVHVINQEKHLGIRNEVLESGILKQPDLCYSYVTQIINQGKANGIRWYECEKVIISSRTYAKLYAEEVARMPLDEFIAEVKSREEVMTKSDDNDLTDTYEESIDRLMPLISENKIDPEDYDINSRDALECYTTAKYVIKKRWPKAEPKILTHPYASYLYANYVLDRPWKQAEPIISTDAKSSLYYAQYVLKRRWPEGEPAIKLNPEYAYFYAQDVIKPFDKNNPNYNNGRWEDPVTELLILNAPWEMPYAERIADMTREDLLAEIELLKKDMAPHDDIDLTGTTDEAINRLMPLITEEDEALPDFNRMTPSQAYNYVFSIMNQGKSGLNIRCPEAEPTILKDSFWASLYARHIMGERWYAAEPDIIQHLGRARIYSDALAPMPLKAFIDEVKSNQKIISQSDDIDLSDTTEEAIDRLMPLIN